MKIFVALICAGSLIWSANVPALTLSADDGPAREAALQWLQIVDSGNYKDAALMMSENVRGTRDWANYFAIHRAALGRVKHRQIAEVKHASSVPGDHEVRQHAIIRFKTSFELPPSVRAGLAQGSGVASKPVAMEEVVLVKMGCCWEVAGYKISEKISDR